jgi:acetate kinase
MHDPNGIKILALNCGSSSLKFEAFEVNSKQAMEVCRGRVAMGPNEN